MLRMVEFGQRLMGKGKRNIKITFTPSPLPFPLASQINEKLLNEKYWGVYSCLGFHYPWGARSSFSIYSDLLLLSNPFKAILSATCVSQPGFCDTTTIGKLATKDRSGVQQSLQQLFDF